MAHATGSDVILELMNTVGELKASMKQQSGQMASMSTKLEDVSTKLESVSTKLESVSTKLEDVSTQADKLSTSMKGNEHQFGRIAKLLGAYAEVTDDRFEELEGRVDKLETASGK